MLSFFQDLGTILVFVLLYSGEYFSITPTKRGYFDWKTEKKRSQRIIALVLYLSGVEFVYFISFEKGVGFEEQGSVYECEITVLYMKLYIKLLKFLSFFITTVIYEVL